MYDHHLWELDMSGNLLARPGRWAALAALFLGVTPGAAHAVPLATGPASVGGGGAGAPASPAAAADLRRGVWSEPQGGLSVRLQPLQVDLVEGIYSTGDPAALPSLDLRARNVSGGRLSLPLTGPATHELDWLLVDQAGARFRPTFLPPPMPRGAAKVPMVTLRPDEEHHLSRLGGLSGFHREGEGSSAEHRWYQSLPAGTYTLTASKVVVGGVSEPFTCPPVTLRVARGDAPVGGLRLALELDRTETRMASGGRDCEPVHLTLRATNEGSTPLIVDMTPGDEGPLEIQIQGESLSSSPAGPPTGPEQVVAPVTLAPGASRALRTALALPGVVAGREHHLRKPGWYQLRMVLRRAAPGPGCPAGSACWTGVVYSNLVWLELR